jgi:hypothetical protein
MPLPPVVIELSATETASPHTRALVDACSSAVTDGECRIGADEPNARAVAIVSWDPRHQRAHIELGTQRAGVQRWAHRDVSFREADPEPERWRAVGLVIGTLVGESERESSTTTPPRPPPPRPPPPRPPPPRPPPPRSSPVGPTLEAHPTHAWLGVEAAAGPALDDGSWRFGAGIAGIYDFPRTPALLSGDLRYLVRPSDEHDVDGRWLTVALGVGVRQEPARVRFEGLAELVADRMEASVSRTRSDTGGRWLPGARLRLDAGVRFESWGMATLGIEATALTQGTVVKLEGEKLGRAPPFTWGLTAAFRFGME